MARSRQLKYLRELGKVYWHKGAKSILGPGITTEKGKVGAGVLIWVFKKKNQKKKPKASSSHQTVNIVFLPELTLTSCVVKVTSMHAVPNVHFSFLF